MAPKARQRASELRYDVHPNVAMTQQVINGMKERTGRTLDEWVRHVVREGPPGAKARREWLKVEHGLGATSATLVAEQSEDEAEPVTAEAYLAAAPRYVDAMFADREDLRAIYEALVRLGRSLGSDVRVSPGRTIVPLYRKHVFAQIRPSTKTRVDLGLALGDLETPGRLVDTGGFAKKDRITRRIPVASVSDIDDDLKDWLRVAYDMDA